MKFRLRLGSPEVGSGSESREPWLTPTLASPLELVETLSESMFVALLTGMSPCSVTEFSSWALKYCSHSLSSCCSGRGSEGVGSSNSPSRLRDLVASGVPELRRVRTAGLGLAGRRSRLCGLVGGRRLKLYRPCPASCGWDGLDDFRSLECLAEEAGPSSQSLPPPELPLTSLSLPFPLSLLCMR